MTNQSKAILQTRLAEIRARNAIEAKALQLRIGKIKAAFSAKTNQ